MKRNWRIMLLSFIVLGLAQACAVAAEPVPAQVEDERACEDRLLAALEQRIDVEFKGTPLRDAAKSLAQKLGVPILLDLNGVEAVGASGDTRVTFELNGVSAKAILWHLLRPMELNYCVRDEVLSISTPEECSSQRTTRVYQVGDLVTKGDDNSDGDSLIVLITGTVTPDVWDSDRWGSINHWGDPPVLVVSSARDVHEQIADLFGQLRSANAPPAKVAAQTAEDKLLAALEKPLDVEFLETPLHEVIDHFRKTLSIPILLDLKAVESVGASAETPITLNLKGQSASRVLQALLKPMELAFDARHEVVRITTNDEIWANRFTKVYKVDDLVQFENPHGDDDSLIELITSFVAPDTWPAHSGPGPVWVWGSKPLLVVSQCSEGHREIAALLRQMRATVAGQPIPHDENDPRSVEEKHRAALEQRIDVQFADTSLFEVGQQLEKKLGVPIEIDEAHSLALGSHVTLEAKGLKGASVLRHIAASLDLKMCVTSDGVELFGSTENANRRTLRMYRVADLVPARKPGAAADDDPVRVFEDLVRNAVLPKQESQPGALYLWAGKLLIVDEPEESHTRIAALLQQLRAAKSPPEK